MRIALHGREFKESTLPLVAKLIQFLKSGNFELLATRNLFEKIKPLVGESIFSQVFGLASKPQGIDLFLSLGGDGTLLDTITYVGNDETPILGVNAGRLGFLANSTFSNFQENFTSVLNEQGAFPTEKRALIRYESDQKIDVFEGLNFGMNEFAVFKTDTSSMITVHAYLNGEYLNAYWADGLIISTPTGSTGYSLSCGGPVLMPHSKSFVLTPVSPHNLNVRPLLVPDDSVIDLTVESRSSHFLVSLDSRSRVVSKEAKITIRKERFSANLVKVENYSFIDTLRHKLHWGLDARN
ncbi:NAD kinase [Aureibacter tunicatorum]|uniref:NAD kinase n=1 Tax=Aureibacter tunicatorum TaxID=866807 RepID=A0AAE3XN26_9BACT|nr:NAD kinase [Aureibacter tunicatorum]MDR6238069.1 NAD+ kinase [Aureibacter tunicatorum]BDD03102.1 NAD kinase [Aureibacter tunicatorum]